MIGLIVGVLGIVAAISAAWWFGRGPRIVTQASGATLLSVPDNNHIKVFYDDRNVDMVTQSIIWVWREGRGTVKGSDVASADPVAVTVPSGTRILDASLLIQSMDTNNVEVKPHPSDETKAIVTFDYLDPRQGAVIEVLHTAETPTAVVLKGTIMGMPKGITPVRSGRTVQVPLGVAGAAAVTIPAHSIPRSLQISEPSDENTSILSEGIEGLLEAVARAAISSVFRWWRLFR
jgi:hypothetical protein